MSIVKAAAILSHLAPRDPDTGGGGTSLPEDRALWPSYLSGGLLPVPSTKTPASARPSNLTATKAKVDLTSIQTHMKRDESSEEEQSARERNPAARGMSSSSLPATSAFSSRYSRPDAVNLRATKSDDRPSSASPVIPPVGSLGAVGGESTGLYYGSVGALPSQHSPSLSAAATSPNPNGFTSQSFQSPYAVSQAPPHARTTSGPMFNGHRSGHRHTRTSSSISSSYTRSSIRGGLDEDDDEMADDDDVGYLDKSSLYGSSYPTSVSPSIPQHRKPDYDFDERDEAEDDDTVDEESDENLQGGAGMEIDMEL